MARHSMQVPLKLGSYAALVLLHAVVLERLHGATLGPRVALKPDIGGGAVQCWGQVLAVGGGVLISPV